MSTTLVEKKQEQDLQRREQKLQEVRHELANAQGELDKAVKQARAVKIVRELITDEMMTDMEYLQGDSMGFKTDKKYDRKALREVISQALLSGYRLVGNEFNIIGGNFYAAQNGLFRVVNDWPGLTDLELIPGVPHIQNGSALVPYRANWRLSGRQYSIDCKQSEDGDTRIPVKVNAGQGPDAVLGKAKRKMLARIQERLSGMKVATEDDIIEGQVA